MSVIRITTFNYNFSSVSFRECLASFLRRSTACFKYCWQKYAILLNHLTTLINKIEFKIIQNIDIIQTKFHHQLTLTRTNGIDTLELSAQRNAIRNLRERKVNILINLNILALNKESKNNSNNRMTINYIRFIEIREEYPSIDAEIRGILIARAQHGATIKDIKDDYHQLNGLIFPVEENITEFLLTIPYVMAYCNEQGTRLFNIMPNNKTKHLLDLVLHQKLHRPQQQIREQREEEQEQEQQYEYDQSDDEKQQKDTIREWQQYSRKINSYNNNNCNNYNSNMYNNDNNLLRHYYTTNYVDHYNHCSKHCHNPNMTMYSYSNNRNKLLQEQYENQQEQHTNGQLLQGYQYNMNEYHCNEDFGELNNKRKHNNYFYRDNCNYFYKRFYNNQEKKLQQQQSFHLVNKQKSAYLTSSNNNSSSEDLNRNIYHQYNNNINHYDHDGKSAINTTTLNQLYNLQSSSSAKSSYIKEPSINIDSDYEAHLFDFLLLGDDFFLHMARMELGCKFKRDEKILQSGLCVSGQNISDAIKRLNQFNISNRSIIINIGSVDIMKRRQLIQIQHDFRELIAVLIKKNAKPILTTLTPLANYAHDNQIKRILVDFNAFIKREAQRCQLTVIDIFTCLVNAKGQILYDCYQKEPRPVTGTIEAYVFWNNIGRQRVLQLIESCLEY